METTASPKSSGRAEYEHGLSPLFASWRRRPSTTGVPQDHHGLHQRGGRLRPQPRRAGDAYEPANIRREPVEAYIESLPERGLSVSTVHPHGRSVSLFFGQLAEEGEVRSDRLPTKNVRVPQPEAKLPEVLSVEEVGKLIKACQKARSP